MAEFDNTTIAAQGLESLRELVVMTPDGIQRYAAPAEGRIRVGRSPDNEVTVPHPSVSRHHAEFGFGTQVTVTDLGSANGVALDLGRKLGKGESTTILPGQVVALGDAFCFVHDPAAEAALGTDGMSQYALPKGTVIEDPVMRDVMSLATRIADSELSVLILGETGVGKEVVAQTIHDRSKRASGPFVGINCGSLSDTLAESELFGHKKGAFTGAQTDKIGLLESANGGTLFFDEVGELTPEMQVRLLRAIEQRTIRPVGALEERSIDIRILAATHRDLRDPGGSFRQDLFFRLNGMTIHVPPLRERPRDIQALAQHFLRHSGTQSRTASLAPETMGILMRHAWPGNVRELRNTIERGVVLSGGGVIEPSHLPPELTGHSALFGAHSRPGAGHQPASPGATAAPMSEADEHRRQIIEALEECAGNQTRAAKLLGVSRRTLTNWLNRYDIPRPLKGR